jgi:hypothetical protein
VINIAGPEYDFGTVVFALLQECEHRRRSFDDVAAGVRDCAKEKLAAIHRAYADIGGSAPYWESLEKEVMKTVVPQYTAAAKQMNELEASGFGVWHQGDFAARLLFALIGLILGSIIIAVPFIPIVENMFAFALTAGGFVYPDIRRFLAERAYAKRMNELVEASAEYQANAKLRYLTDEDMDKMFESGPDTTHRLE